MNALPSHKSPTDRLLTFLLFAAALALYLFSRIGNYFNRDPLEYALDIESGSLAILLSDPHHLLFRPLGLLWYSLWKLAGWQGRSLVPLQTLSALAGAATVALFFAILRKLGCSRRWSCAGAAFLASSYAVWRYSVEVYPHIFLLLFLALTLRLALEARQRGRAWWALVGLANGLAVLFYQTAILLIPAILVAACHRQPSFAAAARRAGAYLVSLLLIVAGLYAAALIATGKTGSPAAILSYLTSYAQGMGPWMGYGRLSLASLLKAPVGIANLFVGEVFLRQQAASSPLAHKFLLQHTRVPPLPSFSPSVWTPATCLLAAISLISLLGLAVWICSAFRRWRRVSSPGFPVASVCVSWLIPFGLFAFWWFPENRQYWMGVLLPLVLLLFLPLANADPAASRTSLPRPSFAVWLYLPILFTTNLFGSILPDHDSTHNPLLTRTRLLLGTVHSGDLVVAASAGQNKHLAPYLEYYLGCKTLDLVSLFFSPQGWPAAAAQAQREIARSLSLNHRAFALAEAVASPSVPWQIARYSTLPPPRVIANIRGLFAPWKLRPVAWQDGDIFIYQVVQPEAPRTRHRARAASGSGAGESEMRWRERNTPASTIWRPTTGSSPPGDG